MTKPRLPMSEEGCITRAVELRGSVAQVAHDLGVSNSSIYHWMDAEIEKSIPLTKARQLNDLCIMAHGEAPFADVFDAPRYDETINLIQELLDGMGLAGDYARKLNEFQQEDSDGGKALTSREAAELFKVNKSRLEKLTRVQAHLSSIANPNRIPVRLVEEAA